MYLISVSNQLFSLTTLNIAPVPFAIMIKQKVHKKGKVKFIDASKFLEIHLTEIYFVCLCSISKGKQHLTQVGNLLERLISSRDQVNENCNADS